MTTNRDVLAMLSELITLTTLDEGSPQSFKVRAYENAKLGLEAHGGDVTALSMRELTALKSVGKATASKVRELIETGSVAKLDALRAAYPPAFVELSHIPGLGPKTLKAVRDHLGVTDVESLKAAIANEDLRRVPGLGITSEAKIARAIERLGLSGKDRRTPIAQALPLAKRLVEDLKAVPGVVDVAYCGSLRRMSETIGDIDITVASTDAPAVMKAILAHVEADEVVLSGETKTSFLTPRGLQVDVRVVAPDEFGAATLYFTGSKAHNIALRQRAMDRSLILNEYGLLTAKDDAGNDLAAEDRTLVASRTEADIYRALGLVFIPPPMREGAGEIEAAASEDGFPELVERSHIKGDLHYHTNCSGDGRSTLDDMVAASAALGYEYLAITEHGEDLTINGVSVAGLREHRDDIARVQVDYPDMTILWGCELNIGPRGELDYDADFRAELQWNVASVHSYFDASAKQQTERLVRAIMDPTVNAVGHLTGRYIGRRPGIELEIDILIEALAHFDVALEINGALQRLDAAPEVVRKAVERGVKLIISTDSHHVSEVDRMEYGVLVGQRGWVPRDLVVNTWNRDRFLEWSRHRR